MVKQIGGSCAILVNALALNEMLLSIRGVRVEARAGSPSPRPSAEPGQPVTPPLSRGTPIPTKGFSSGMCGRGTVPTEDKPA